MGVFSFALLICFSMFLAPSMFSQSASTGAISGTLKDSSGSSVPNATVTLTSLDTNQTRTATTTSDGTYRFGFLNSGAYKLRFEATGFNSVDIPSVTVIVTETTVIDQALQVGSQQQQVTITGEAEQVDTASSTVGTLVSGSSVASLPLTSRNYTNLLGLAAGANVGVFNGTVLGRGTTDILVNGALAGQNNYQMDGASIINTAGTGTGADSGGATTGVGIVNPDSVQEFKIQTSSFDASYGRNAGANVNVVTKSGTNEFHGTAFEFFRNTILNANDFFRSEALAPAPNGRPVLNQNQFGGTIGGPVKKNKLFFFASYQRTWQANGAAGAGYATPTIVGIPAGTRSSVLGSPWVNQLGAAFCPTTLGGTANSSAGNLTKAGTGVQVACDGSNISQVALNLLNLKVPGSIDPNGYYIPGSSNGKNQTAFYSIPAHYTEDQGVGNFDYVISSKNTFSGKYFYSAVQTLGTIGTGATSATPTTGLPGAPGSLRFPNMYMLAKLTTIVSTNIVNEMRASLQRSVVFDYPGFVNTNGSPVTNTQLGVTSVEPTFDPPEKYSISGLFQFGTGVNPSVKFNTSWEIADSISWSHGKHTIRSGVEFERDRLNWIFVGLSNSTLTYQTFQDFLIGRPGCGAATNPNGSCTSPTTAQCSIVGNPLCNPVPNSGIANGNISGGGTSASLTAPGGDNHYFRTPAASAFVQDDIKVNNSLTLNLGLRWEYYGIFYDQPGNLTNFNPSLAAAVNCPLALGACPAGTGVGATAAAGTLAGYVVPSNFMPSLYPANPFPGLTTLSHKIETANNAPKDAFAPRIGFAWKPLKSDRLVVRGGAGIFYDRSGVGSLYGASAQDFPYTVPVWQNTPATNYLASNALPYPGSVGAALGWANASRWFGVTNPGLPNAAPTNPAPPGLIYVNPNWQVPTTYQYNLNTQYEFAPSWVLELGYVGSHTIHQFLASIPGGGSPAQIYVNLPQLASPANPVNGFIANSSANSAGRVPYLGFSPTGLGDIGDLGTTHFNSAQVTVRKQVSHGLTMQASYTWARVLGTADHFFYNNPLVPNNGPSGNYRPQRLSVSYSYDLPTGHHEGFVGKFTNGWNLSGVTIVQNGLPLTLTNSQGGAVYGIGGGSNQQAEAQFADGMSVANIGNSGSTKQRVSNGWFNKTAFASDPIVGAIPLSTPGCTANLCSGATGFGNVGIGNILGPGQFNFDATIQKTTTVGGIHENATLVFRTEFFNVWNHAQFAAPTGSQLDTTNGSLGQVNQTSVNPRLIQFALKYIF
jgi:hypothetical protein